MIYNMSNLMVHLNTYILLKAGKVHVTLPAVNLRTMLFPRRSGQPFRNRLFPRRSGRSSWIRLFPRRSRDQVN